MTKGKKRGELFIYPPSFCGWGRAAASDAVALPSVEEINKLTDKIFSLMFYNYLHIGPLSRLAFERRKSKIFVILKKQIRLASGVSSKAAANQADGIIRLLPVIREALLKDARAICDADPAAASTSEVIICYPGFFATAAYRLAHRLYKLKIPYIPRIITEYAHGKTGIDIHPGATVGEGFCIDHGTGVVIGETAVIGNNVRIYQGVTLGAKSLESKGMVNSLRGVKRHPEIGNNCIIYAGATILGGDTVIGDGCVIGGNVWLTHSVPSGQRVYYKDKNGLSD